mmetsp:Transcript_45168/g.55318  ORF Transcript_45168/g.55318 Transcript_45168/m.55318 type:complete len:237 (+) Transcript_45168:222-932(+)
MPEAASSVTAIRWRLTLMRPPRNTPRIPMTRNPRATSSTRPAPRSATWPPPATRPWAPARPTPSGASFAIRINARWTTVARAHGPAAQPRRSIFQKRIASASVAARILPDTCPAVVCVRTAIPKHVSLVAATCSVGQLRPTGNQTRRPVPACVSHLRALPRHRTPRSIPHLCRCHPQRWLPHLLRWHRCLPLCPHPPWPHVTRTPVARAPGPAVPRRAARRSAKTASVDVLRATAA